MLKIWFEKLSLISALKAKVIRSGKNKMKFLVEDLVQDDIIMLDMGSQIAADFYCCSW